MPVRNAVLGPGKDPKKLQRAWEFRREMTPEEQMLWRQLRGNRLNGIHFRRHCVIAGYIVDFFCHAAGLVVEVDGAIHEGREQEDRERDRVLSTRGFHVLRFSNEQLRHDLEAVMARIADQAGSTTG